MSDKVKIDDLKTKIKSLQSQIEEKNHLLKSVKTTQPAMQQKIKVLNSITETKIKNLNNSLHYLQKENESYRKSPDKSQLTISKTMDEEAKNNSLLPIIKEKNSKHSRQQSDEARLNYNKELFAKMNLSPMLNKGNYNMVSNDYEFSNIIRQLDALKSENLLLKKKLKDGTIKYNKEMEIRTNELEEMGSIRKDYVQLSEKFEEMKKLVKIKNGNNDNDLIVDTEEALADQIKELEKKYSVHIYENERLRQSLKTIKLKVKYMLLEKKKFLQANLYKRNDNCCQYSMNLKEEPQELKPNAEEELDLQEVNKEINENDAHKLPEEMDDKNCEVNHEEFEEKNEEILKEDPTKNEEQLEAMIGQNEVEDIQNKLAYKEDNDLENNNKIEIQDGTKAFLNEDIQKVKGNSNELDQNLSTSVKTREIDNEKKRKTVQNFKETMPKSKQDIDKKRKTMGNVAIDRNNNFKNENIIKNPQNKKQSVIQEKKHSIIQETEQKIEENEQNNEKKEFAYVSPSDILEKSRNVKSSDIEDAKKRLTLNVDHKDQRIRYQSQDLQKRVVNVTANYIDGLKFPDEKIQKKKNDSDTKNLNEDKFANDPKVENLGEKDITNDPTYSNDNLKQNQVQELYNQNQEVEENEKYQQNDETKRGSQFNDMNPTKNSQRESVINGKIMNNEQPNQTQRGSQINSNNTSNDIKPINNNSQRESVINGKIIDEKEKTSEHHTSNDIKNANNSQKDSMMNETNIPDVENNKENGDDENDKNEFVEDLREEVEKQNDQNVQDVHEKEDVENKTIQNKKGTETKETKHSQNNRYRHSVNDAALESRNFKKPDIKEKKFKDDSTINKNNQNPKVPFFQEKKENQEPQSKPQNLDDINEETDVHNKYIEENQMDKTEFINDLAKIEAQNESNLQNNDINNQNNDKSNSLASMQKYSINVNSTKPLVIFVLGGPGCGKGTQCAKIKEKFQFEHLSTGDLLRDELKSKGEYAPMMETLMKEGKLVPSEILIQIIKKTITNASYINRKILLDGFPRNLENLTKWDEIIGDLFDVAFLLFFECSVEILEERILERAKTSGRSDDNLDSFKKRIKTYEEETKPVLQVFEKRGQVLRISSENPVEEVFSEVENLFKNFGF